MGLGFLTLPNIETRCAVIHVAHRVSSIFEKLFKKRVALSLSVVYDSLINENPSHEGQKMRYFISYTNPNNAIRLEPYKREFDRLAELRRFVKEGVRYPGSFQVEEIWKVNSKGERKIFSL